MDIKLPSENLKGKDHFGDIA